MNRHTRMSTPANTTLMGNLPALLFAVVVLSAARAFAAPTLDQSCEAPPANYAGVDATHQVWQTFTPAVSGPLSSVELLIDRLDGGIHGDLLATIVDVSAGVPGTTVLASATVPYASVTPLAPSWVSISFTSPPSLASGTQYAINLRSPGTSGVWRWFDAFGDLYGGGQEFYGSDPGTPTAYPADVGFRTYMDVDLCGNDVIDSGEACDDGNALDGDCCTSACELPACSNGTPNKAQLGMTGGSDPSVSLKWSDDGASAAFGSPATTTDYTLCVYDADGVAIELTAPAGSDHCGKKPCWSTKGSPVTKVSYSDKRAQPINDGLSLIKGKVSGSGKAKLKLGAHGSNLPPFDLGTTLTSVPVTVLLNTVDAGCWQAVFSDPASLENDGERLRATVR